MTPIRFVDIKVLANTVKVISHRNKNKFNLICEEQKDGLRISYRHKFGGFHPKPFCIPKQIALDNYTAAIFGLLQAECNKKPYAAEFAFVNVKPCLINSVLKFFRERMKIENSLWMCAVNVQSYPKPSKKEVVSFWKGVCNLGENKFTVSFSNKNNPNASKYGSISIRVRNNAFHTLMLSLLDLIKKEAEHGSKDFAAAYLSGLLAGDGSVKLGIYGAIDNVSIAYNGTSNELQHYSKVLKNLNIPFKIDERDTSKAVRIFHWKNFFKILELTNLKPFFDYEFQNIKFIKGFLKNQDVKSLQRLAWLKSSTTYKNFAATAKIDPRSAHDLLTRWVKFGFSFYSYKSKRGDPKPHLFKITENGKKFLEIFNSLS